MLLRVNCLVEISVSLPVISFRYFSISVMFTRIWKGQYTGTTTWKKLTRFTIRVKRANLENNFMFLIFLYYLQTKYEENNSKRIEKVKYYEILYTVTKGIVLMCGRNATSLFDVADLLLHSSRKIWRGPHHHEVGQFSYHGTRRDFLPRTCYGIKKATGPYIFFYF